MGVLGARVPVVAARFSNGSCNAEKTSFRHAVELLSEGKVGRARANRKIKPRTRSAVPQPSSIAQTAEDNAVVRERGEVIHDAQRIADAWR